MNIPIVTLDKIYITPDNQNIFFLDCTRIDNSNNIVARTQDSIDTQILKLSKYLKKQIILADDVVFSGSVLRDIINRFNTIGIEVVGIISSICTEQSYYYFNQNLKYGLKANYLLSNNVIDQICERDFYFGIAGSGIMIKSNNNLFKAPYFKPYGNPYERASIPKEYEKYFSQGCLERSLYIWQEIDKLQERNTLIKDLPEKIINTEPSKEVIKTLKKEMNRL